MRRYLTFWLGALSLFVGTSIGFAQAPPNFLWLRQGNAISNGFGKGLFTDANGNSYVTGHIIGNANLGGIVLTNPGDVNIFVAKYDSSGNVLWAQIASSSGASFDEGLSITADAASNCFLTGIYSGAVVNFGSIHLTNAEAGTQQIFVAKYDYTGTAQWAVQAGAKGLLANGVGIALDANGYCYVTGVYRGNAIFSGATLTNGGGQNIFIAKYSGTGALQWVRGVGGSGPDTGYGIGIDSLGYCYAVGSFSSATVDFGGLVVTNAGGSDFFLAKYDTDGIIQWVQRGGGAGSDAGYDVAVDSAGNSFVTGVFSGPAIFGTKTLTNAGNKNVFVAKYDTRGNLLWIQQGRGSGNEDDFQGGIKLDASGNCYIGGAYLLNATFGGVALTNAGDHDIFVAKYDNNGAFQWVQRAGGKGYDYCRQVGVDGFGNVYLTGCSSNAAAFGAFTITSAQTPGSGTGPNNYPDDLFLAKLGPNLTTNLELAISATNELIYLSISSTAGQSVLIDRLSSLSDPTSWVNWSNLVLPASPHMIIDSDSTNSPRGFYPGRLPGQ